MTGDDTQYESKSVLTIRGMEARNIAKLEKEGWEFVSQNPAPLMRTELTFRRIKPKHPVLIWAAAVKASLAHTKTKQPRLFWGVGADLVLIIGAIITTSVIAGERNAPEPVAQSTATPVVPAPSEDSTQVPAPIESPEATPAESASEQILTVENSEDFADLLAGSDQDSDGAERFANKYAGRTVEFDANIASVTNRASDNTRFGLLVLAGNFEEPPMSGPSFKFDDVNTQELHLTGSSIPDSVEAGDNVHIVAQLGKFNRVQGLYFLEPISTELR